VEVHSRPQGIAWWVISSKSELQVKKEQWVADQEVSIQGCHRNREFDVERVPVRAPSREVKERKGDRLGAVRHRWEDCQINSC